MRLGHRVTVVATSPTSNDEVSDGAGVAVVAISRLGLRWGLRDVPKVADLVRSLGGDTINVQYVPHMYGRGGVSPGIALLIWLLRKATGRRIILTCHEIASPLAISPQRLFAALCHRLQLALALAARPRVVVTNSGDARRLRNWLPKASPIVIPVGASIPCYPGSRARGSKIRKSLGLEGHFLIGDLSPFNANKIPSRLLTVLEVAGGGARLVLIGGIHGQARRAELLRAAETMGLAGRIIQIPYLEPALLSDHLALLDVYVDTGSRGASTRSTTLVTALAHGIPVVAYRGRETPEYFKSGEHLLLVEPGDPGGLGAAVLQVRDSSGLGLRLAAGARKVHEDHLTWETIASALAEPA